MREMSRSVSDIGFRGQTDSPNRELRPAIVNVEPQPLVRRRRARSWAVPTRDRCGDRGRPVQVAPETPAVDGLHPPSGCVEQIRPGGSR